MKNVYDLAVHNDLYIQQLFRSLALTCKKWTSSYWLQSRQTFPVSSTHSSPCFFDVNILADVIWCLISLTWINGLVKCSQKQKLFQSQTSASPVSGQSDQIQKPAEQVSVFHLLSLFNMFSQWHSLDSLDTCTTPTFFYIHSLLITW